MTTAAKRADTLSAEDADEGLSIRKQFGAERFTLADYFRQIAGGIGLRFPMREDDERMRRRLAWLVSIRLLETCPGPRGGEGWKIAAGIAPALDRRAAKRERDAEKRRAEQAAYQTLSRQLLDEPKALRSQLETSLASHGLTPMACAALLTQIDALIASEDKRRRFIEGRLKIAARSPE